MAQRPPGSVLQGQLGALGGRSRRNEGRKGERVRLSVALLSTLRTWAFAVGDCHSV